MSTVIVNGVTYSDAGESANDMRDGGHREHLLPMLGNAITDLAAKVATAQIAADLSVDSANIAPWVSGSTYATGEKAWSLIDYFPYRRKTDGAGTTDPHDDGTNWALLTTTVFNDAEVHRCMFRDCGYTFVDKGSSGTDAQTVDFSAGTHQRIKATGAFTLGFSNWPPAGNFGEVLLELVADGTARAITFPAGTKFVKYDGSVTTTFSELLVTLQSANDAIDWLLFWTRDAGTTLYCKVVR